MAPTKFDMPALPPGEKLPDFSNYKGPEAMAHVPDRLENQTVRMFVHSSISGSRVRIELSNAFGKGQVSIGEAHLALRKSGSAIVEASDRRMTFSGNPGIDILPGAVIVSDPVDIDLPASADLAVSLYIIKSSGMPANHSLGLHSALISSGNTVSATQMTAQSTTTAYLWLRSVDVAAPDDAFAIACLGDSITDGYATTVDADQAWPALLAKRLNESAPGRHVAVLNEGISGNQVLRDGAGVSALARFDRDVLSEPGVRWVVLLEGINDINIHGQVAGPGRLTSSDLIQGDRQLIARAHLHGIKVMGATLTPDEGVWLWGPMGEATRLEANHWIRTSGEFDAVVDFDAATRDSQHPSKLQAKYNSGDNIHPNDLGNAAMADAFDLKTFLQTVKP
jgi:lysophospholipase L1-like esterase